MLDLRGVAQEVLLREAVKGKDAYDHLSAGYGLEDFRQPSLFPLLDFNKPIEEPPSIWRGFIYEGDLALVAGVPKLGKSWLTMALAVAVANGTGSFLGAEVKPGRVLYFDEENPPDVIQRRMLSLGLTNFYNVAMVAAGGVRLDTHPELLIQQVSMFQPNLVIIDSLARVHAKDENSFSEMSEILNGVLKPLARDTGAGVLLIHHHDKGGHGPRGSSDIEAAVDTILNIRGTPGSGSFSVAMRGRRRRSDDPVWVIVKDIPGSGTRLELA
jgi:predicted ATP-dependent serine protease